MFSLTLSVISLYIISKMFSASFLFGGSTKHAPAKSNKNIRVRRNTYSIECIHCGNHEELIFGNERNRRLIETHTCLQCDSWLQTYESDKINAMWNGKLVINGVRWMASLATPETNRTDVLFVLNLDTNKIYRLYNFVKLGAIPSHFRDMFPDNAQIVNE